MKNSTELRGHQGGVERVAFSPVSESELASCGTDGTVRFWDVRTKASIGEVKVGGEAFTLAWKPDGKEIIVGKKVGTTPPLFLLHTKIYEVTWMYLSSQFHLADLF